MTTSALQRLHANVAGDGNNNNMLFVHGFGCDRNIWRLVAPAFQAEHRTLVYDHAGNGDSIAAWNPQRHASLEGYVQDLLDVMEESAMDRVVGVGHSIGSIIMLLASIVQPERFSRLVLLCPSPRFLNDPPDYVGGFEAGDLAGLFQLMESNHFGWAQFLAPMAMGAHNPVALTHEFEQALRALEPRIARHFAGLVFNVDVRHRLREASVPSVLVQCREDSIVPVEVGRWMHRHLPDSRLVELDASGHCPHISHPDLVIGTVRDAMHG